MVAICTITFGGTEVRDDRMTTDICAPITVLWKRKGQHMGRCKMSRKVMTNRQYIYPDCSNTRHKGPMSFMSRVDFTLLDREVCGLQCMINPSNTEMATAVSNETSARKGAERNRISKVVLQSHPSLGECELVNRIPGRRRNEVNVAHQRKVQMTSVIREYACRGIARTRRRKSQQLHGITIAAKHSAVMYRGFTRQESFAIQLSQHSISRSTIQINKTAYLYHLREL